MNKLSQKTQTAEIIQHLKTHGSITSIEAIQLYGATRLAGIIYNLRKRGFKIETLIMNGRTRYGGAVQYAKYLYHGEE